MKIWSAELNSLTFHYWANYRGKAIGYDCCPIVQLSPDAIVRWHYRPNPNHILKGNSIIGSGSGFTVNLGSDSLGKWNDLGVSSVSRIHFGFGFIVNPDPDPIIE